MRAPAGWLCCCSWPRQAFSRRWFILSSGSHAADLATSADLDGIFMVSRSGRHDRDVTGRYPGGVSSLGESVPLSVADPRQSLDRCGMAVHPRVQPGRTHPQGVPNRRRGRRTRPACDLASDRRLGVTQHLGQTADAGLELHIAKRPEAIPCSSPLSQTRACTKGSRLCWPCLQETNCEARGNQRRTVTPN